MPSRSSEAQLLPPAPASRRAPRSQTTERMPIAASTKIEFHFTAQARPKQMPAAIRHGRSSRPGPKLPARSRHPAWVRWAASRCRNQSRSAATQATPLTMNSAWKMSSSPIRLIVKASPSLASSIPAMAPTSVERDSRRASRMVTSTSSVPATSEDTRQPKEFMP